MSDSVRPHTWQPTRLPCPWESVSRQEHWSGLPFPSPMHGRESEVTESCPTLSDPMDCTHQAPPSMGFSRKEHWGGVPLPSPTVLLVLQMRWCGKERDPFSQAIIVPSRCGARIHSRRGRDKRQGGMKREDSLGISTFSIHLFNM